MVRFVLVDDEANVISHITNLLNEIVKEEKEIVSFSKIDAALKKEIDNTDMKKVYILDIELGHKVSGISIAKLIRDIDWESEIIFITNHDKMFESAHRTVYKVFDFIEKFHEFDKRFKKDILEILKTNFDNKMFIYKLNNVELSLYYKSILYIYKEDRKLIIKTDKKINNTYTLSISLKEILTLLDYRFVQCHKSCIVNKLRISKKDYKDGYFILDTGEKVYMLSKKYKDEVEK